MITGRRRDTKLCGCAPNLGQLSKGLSVLLGVADPRHVAQMVARRLGFAPSVQFGGEKERMRMTTPPLTGQRDPCTTPSSDLQRQPKCSTKS